MTLNISFNEESQIFHLSNGSISYIMEVVNQKYLAHCYWGHALDSYNKLNQVPMYKKTFAAFADLNQAEFSLEFLPQEFPQAYLGDYKQSAIMISQMDGQDILRLEYDSYEIIDGLPNIPDLPHAREEKEDRAKTLVLKLIDKVVNVEVHLLYSIFENTDVIIRSNRVINRSNVPVTIQHLASASWDVAFTQQYVTNLYGTHQGEFQIQHGEIQHGQFKLGTSRGASGPQYMPFIALSQTRSEEVGEVRAMTLIYSGNHIELVERDQYNQLRVQIGLNNEQFTWLLKPNETFYSPQAVLVFSPYGFNGMSKIFHSFTRCHLIHPNYRNMLSPILINSWEMTYFSVDESKMLALADKVSELGFEAVVLDDGWFVGRNSSKSSLGDWRVDQQKFPNDLFPIVKHIHHLGMRFGVWFEPEMISPNSELLKQHPTWVMKSSQYPAMYGRNQYILDLTQKEVQDFIVEILSRFIRDYQVDYIKWDMNRHITEPFSQCEIQQHPKAYSHLYILGLYRVIEKLTAQFPNVLFENCSSGGGRFDFGMLYYFPQTWASDNTDGLDRQYIQYGASYLFHPYQMTGHISATPNHQTQRNVPLMTRMALATSVNMGYELDLLQMNEQDATITKAYIANYKKIRQFLKTASFYRLSSPFSSNMCAWLFESPTKDSYILVAFCNQFYVNQHHHLLKLPYLNPEDSYYIKEQELIVSGSELVYSGIHLSFDVQDWSSIILHLEVCSK